MAESTAVLDEHAHAHEEHAHHGEFIAHHFDTPQQQFDSGKLGIWVFLSTEVLFFSGLFCAYTLYRAHHPEIFVDASQFLDKVLGGINTVVLLFSSLTMAWAVRAAQLGRNAFAAKLILITMVCAAVFLGVKAVEYSHKWDLGIYPISHYSHVEGYHVEPGAGTLAAKLHISEKLVWLSVVPLVLVIGFGVASVIFRLTERKLLSVFFLALTIMMGGYFLGAVGGQIYQRWHDAGAAAHGGGEEHVTAADFAATGAGIEEMDTPHTGPGSPYPQQIGVFFSIYYCMTGLHAIHVIGGMVALSWLYLRCLKSHFRPDYFGPVDFIGLYWHLVDLIWIYLFPLLYLIN